MPPHLASFPADSVALAPFGQPIDVLREVLEVSLTGFILYTPLYNHAGELVDFTFAYLNPAAQRMMDMPAYPTATHMQQFPQSKEHGTFAFHVDAFITGEPRHYNINYQADGYDNYYRLAARRSGNGLLVSFTDTADQPRTAVEVALRESQIREQAARADAEAQRQRFYDMLVQLPAQIATYHGPDHVFAFVNERYQQYFPERALLGNPLREIMPEAAAESFIQLLDQVYQTGEPFHGQELEFWQEDAVSGKPRQLFINAFYHPLRNTLGQVDGVLDFSYDVTEQVRARQELQQLNQELEARVAQRTEALQVARAEAEEQRNRLERLFMQAPALINIFSGPNHILTFVHPSTSRLLENRLLQGLPRRQALPELPEERHAPLDEVYQTGRSFRAQEVPYQLDLRNDGQLHDVYLDLTYLPIYDAAGQVEGIMSFALDVTERVQARQQAEMLQAQVLAAARRQVKERETYYQILADTPAAVGILRGPTHRFEYVNRAYQQLFPGRQLVGRTVAEALPETVPAGYTKVLDQVYQSGETFFGTELPLTIEQPDGLPAQEVYFTFTYQAYRENNEVVGVSIFSHNVTEQVQARAQREAERRRLQRLFMEAPAAICILAGPELVFELVNPGYQRLLPDRQLLGRPFLEAVPELAEHSAVQVFRQIYQTGITHEEYGIRVPLARDSDGVLEDRYFNYIQQARRDAQGQIDGVLVFAFEVTEQVRARQASEASAQQLRLLTDALPVLISYVDQEKVYRFANRAYEAWFSLTPEEIVGQHLWEVVGEVAYQHVQSYIERALAGERVSFEARMQYRPDFVRHAHITFVPDVQDGRVAGFFSLLADVTEQVEAREAVERSARQALALAEELSRTNEQLTYTNIDLDTFIYIASHDLKAPISNVEGLLDTLRRELPAASQTGDIAYILELMQDSVERFKKTIEHLTDVSRLQKEHSQPLVQVALAEVIEDVRLDLAPLLQQVGGRLQVHVAKAPTILFSEKNLRSVIYNLLSNALKYHHPDRPALVQIRAWPEDDVVVLQVQDNGLGFEQSRGAQLFTMFHRLHTHVEGSGVGLYMVKRLVENAGGHIKVSSQENVGSTFTVYFKR